MGLEVSPPTPRKHLMKKNKSKSTEVVSKERVLYSIIKLNMGLYQLIKLTLKEDGTYQETTVHVDIPSICYGKLLQLIQQQGFADV